MLKSEPFTTLAGQSAWQLLVAFDEDMESVLSIHAWEQFRDSLANVRPRMVIELQQLRVRDHSEKGEHGTFPWVALFNRQSMLKVVGHLAARETGNY